MVMPFAPTRAMVLAAGLGTRMKPGFPDLPKALVPVCGRPLIDHALDRLAAAGVETVVVNVHDRAEMLRAHLAARRAPEILISDESELLLETGGGIARVLSLLGPTPFYTMNVDSLWIEGMGSALGRLAAQWDEARMDAFLLLAPVLHAVGYDGRGDFLMDATGRLTRRPETWVAPFAWTGVQIVHPRLFAGCPDGPFSLNLLFDRAIAEGRLFGLRHDGIWMHVGTPEGRAAAEEVLRDL